VVSPNGDGVDEAQPLRYRVVQPSTVEARLVGPGGTVLPLDAGVRRPGSYSFSWDGLEPDGSPAPEGTWRLVVEAVDGEGRESAATRSFALNRTLGFVSVRPAGSRRLRVSFALARRAYVAVRVVGSDGSVLKTVARRTLGAGATAVTWNGRIAGGRRAKPGTYVARVSATNDAGRVEVARPFVLRAR
jgi:hypothetical protein